MSIAAKGLVCIRKLINMRDSIMNEIEARQTLEDVTLVGEEMVKRYLNL